MTHTPVPWGVLRGKDSVIVYIPFRGSEDELSSFIYLHTAAPEMLAILEELRESSTCCGTYDLLEETTWASPDLVDRIEAAIRKARGEE